MNNLCLSMIVIAMFAVSCGKQSSPIDSSVSGATRPLAPLGEPPLKVIAPQGFSEVTLSKRYGWYELITFSPGEISVKDCKQSAPDRFSLAIIRCPVLKNNRLKFVDEQKKSGDIEVSLRELMVTIKSYNNPVKHYTYEYRYSGQSTNDVTDGALINKPLYILSFSFDSREPRMMRGVVIVRQPSFANNSHFDFLQPMAKNAW